MEDTITYLAIAVVGFIVLLGGAITYCGVRLFRDSRVRRQQAAKDLRATNNERLQRLADRHSDITDAVLIMETVDPSTASTLRQLLRKISRNYDAVSGDVNRRSENPMLDPSAKQSYQDYGNIIGVEEGYQKRLIGVAKLFDQLDEALDDIRRAIVSAPAELVRLEVLVSGLHAYLDTRPASDPQTAQDRAKLAEIQYRLEAARQQLSDDQAGHALGHLQAVTLTCAAIGEAKRPLKPAPAKRQLATGDRPRPSRPH